MDNGYRTKPIWVADDDGHVDALFVLPFEQRPIDENVLSNGPGIEIREAIEGSMQTYGVVTLKRTSGPWITQAEQDADTEERVPWLTRVIAKRTPNVVVFLGVNAARQCIPEIKDKSVLQLKHTFQTWKIQGDGFRKSQLCFVYQQPTAIVRDHEDHFRIPEQFAKIRAASRGLGYHKLAESKSLGFKAACRYIDWLCNDYQGMIAFDTETYSLNQVHNTRLGTMQFATETDKAYVLLWDTDYCPYTPAEKEILRKKLVRLFGARKTSLRGWIMHNAQFDMGQVFAEFKVRIPYSKLIHDTMNLLHLLDENQLNRNRDVFKLKEAAKQFLGYFKYDSEAIEARSTGVIMDLPVDKLVAYGGMDAYVTLRLYRVLMVWAKLTNYHDNLIRISNELHNRALRLYAELKQNGFGIDQYRLRELLSPSSVIKKRLTEIEQIYRKDPMILAINEQIYKRNNKASKVFRVPFIFDMNKPGFRNELFFHSKLGYKLPPNGEGKFSSNKKFQELYQYALDADGQPLYPLVALFQEAQSLSQLTKMYIKPIYESIVAGKHGDTCDGRVHPNFNMAGTVTGRMSSNNPNCFASGTQVSVPCDITVNPKQTMAIEDLRVGDWVYCLDDKQELAARRVKNVWNQGKQEVIRIHFKSGNGRSKTWFDVTPDHKIRGLNFRWKTAGKLKIGDRVMALTLSENSGYALTNRIPHETSHRAIVRSLVGKRFIRNRHVHHIDGRHGNNNVDNLIALTTAEHGAAHAALGKQYQSMRWSQHTRYMLLRKLAQCRGSIARCRSFDIEFSGFRDALLREGIDYKTVSNRYGQDGKYLTAGRIAAAIQTSSNTEIASQKLAIGTRLLKRLCSFYGLDYSIKSKKAYQPDLPRSEQHLSCWTRKERKQYARGLHYGANNHTVTKIEVLDKPVTVWDIEVEEFHNFFASEVNVSNCQQIPRSDTPTKKAIKALFIAQPEVKRSGKIVMRALMQADFKAAEVRMWGALSNDRKLCALLRESFEKCAEFRANPTDDSLRIAAELTGDVHKQTASLMFSVDIYTVPWDEPMYKDMRQGTKSITFGMMFDRGIKSLAAQIKKTEEEAQGLQDKFFGKFCEGKAWLDNQKATMRDQGYVETPFGRRRRADIIYSDDRYMRQTAERYAVNAPIQSTASDYAMFATSLLQERILEQGLEHEYKIVNSVHDSVVVDFIADYEHMKWLSETIREIYTIEAPKRLEAAFDFKLLAPMDIDLEISYRKYRKCDECGAMFHMHEDKCTGKIKTGEKDDKGKPITKKCGSKKFHEEAMRYHSYGYSMTLVETPEGLANAALSF